jgi:hypothetical protein
VRVIAVDSRIETMYLIVLIVFLFSVFQVRRSSFYRPLLALIESLILVLLLIDHVQNEMI